MAKYSDMVALLEWMDKKNTKQPKTNKAFRMPKLKDMDIPELIAKKKKEVEALDAYLNELNRKKEEKKGRSLTGIEWFIIGLLMYPVVGPLYNIATHNLEMLGHAR